MDQADMLLCFLDDVRHLLLSFYQTVLKSIMQPKSLWLENCVDGEQKWVLSLRVFWP
jgi:hypothetical protein